MAKLNARVSSERQNRTVSKSGNEWLVIELWYKNTPSFHVQFKDGGPLIVKDKVTGEILLEY